MGIAQTPKVDADRFDVNRRPKCPRRLRSCE
jgi:hypothetical protein